MIFLGEILYYPAYYLESLSFLGLCYYRDEAKILDFRQVLETEKLFAKAALFLVRRVQW